MWSDFRFRFAKQEPRLGIWHVCRLEQERFELVLSITELEIVVQKQGCHNHLDDVARKPSTGTRMSPEPELHRILAGRDKFVFEFATRPAAFICLLSKLVESQTIELERIRVVLRIG